mmetsp:Transcript_8880/g.28352  ORF Transcript_8880/g.28352 Transcript_8880/m.28352 type:complete len:104 (-) Transcript_8880:877-1188(-)
MLQCLRGGPPVIFQLRLSSPSTRVVPMSRSFLPPFHALSLPQFPRPTGRLFQAYPTSMQPDRRRYLRLLLVYLLAIYTTVCRLDALSNILTVLTLTVPCKTTA